MIETALATAAQPIEILLYLNDDDPTLEEYKRLIDPKYYTVGPDRSPGYSWNKLAEACSGEILLM
jgi:hypothetical protein